LCTAWVTRDSSSALPAQASRCAMVIPCVRQQQHLGHRWPQLRLVLGLGVTGRHLSPTFSSVACRAPIMDGWFSFCCKKVNVSRNSPKSPLYT
jgi:hypothetical protein